jgi:hypothetical protein
MASNSEVTAHVTSSAPPAKTMSCRPKRIRSAAWPMQCVDVAHADVSE